MTDTIATPAPLEVSANTHYDQEVCDRNHQLARELGAGCHVKIGFKAEDGVSEWMWAEVTGMSADSITAILKNEPDYVEGLAKGDELTFGFDRIFSVVEA